MDHGLIESQAGRKPSNSTKFTHKCALALAAMDYCGTVYFAFDDSCLNEREAKEAAQLQFRGSSYGCLPRMFSALEGRILELTD
jgi:hypothetical protein